MKIPVGKYTLQSDSFSMWITEKYEGEDSKGRKRERERKVAGYSWSWNNLVRDFCDRKFRSSEAETVKELLKELKQTLDDMKMLNEAAIKNDFKLIRKTAKEKGVK